MEIAREYDLAVVEDAAAALGSLVGERHVGSIGDVGCFSFQGAKVAIAGQGGVVVTNDASLAERARCISSYGRTDSVKPYWSDHVGWNFGLANLPAALAASQLKRLSTLVQHKREIAATYSQQLDSVQGIRFVREPNGARSNYAYPIAEVLPGAVVSRDELLEGLKIWGVDARPAQPRISDMPMFEARFSNTVSRHAEERGIILPSAHRLSIEQIVEICGIVRGILHET